MFTEQRIRAGLFYLSVCIFLIGLPFILSFALGYKFDSKTLKFTRTGLIFIKTQPQGADIYLNEKLLSEKTPATLSELLPGTYNIRVESAKYYPWSGEVEVAPRKAVLLDRIILFPVRQNIKQISEQRFDYFWADEEKDAIYYIDYPGHSIYISNLDGKHCRKAADFTVIKPLPVKWENSYDRKKIIYFNRHQIGLVDLEIQKDKFSQDAFFILNYPAGSIRDIFWYHDSYHFIVVSDRKIEILEAKPKTKPVELVTLSKRNAPVFYSSRDNAVYFMDSQRASEGEVYDNLYKLELNTKNFLLPEFLNLGPNEQK